MSGPSIRIIATPPGDAPLWVREKWVGLELPIVGSDSSWSMGVSVHLKPTMLHHLWAIIRGRSVTVEGYQVEAGRAVDILAVSSPEAAAWWRDSAPGLLRPGRLFLFDVEACRLSPP
jgi:hypothetical protein